MDSAGVNLIPFQVACGVTTASCNGAEKDLQSVLNLVAVSDSLRLCECDLGASTPVCI